MSQKESYFGKHRYLKNVTLQQNFEAAFKPYFKIHESIPVRETKRVVYLMERKNR